MGKSDLLWRFLVHRSREHVPVSGRSHVSHFWLRSVPWQEGRAVPSAWGHPCGAELSCCSSCVTFKHNTQTALAGINCPQRAAVYVECVRLPGVFWHTQSSLELWSGTGQGPSSPWSIIYVQFLQQVFPKRRLRRNYAELSNGTWETSCAEGDSEYI